MNPLKDRPLRFLAALFFAALACSFARPSFAQVYPIHVTTQLQGPYTPYLSDYTTPGSQKLLVQLRVNDPTLAEYRCKLRVTIEGVGITLRTKQSFIADPIVLSGGGIPEIFYGTDLASYFDPANLDFGGFSRSEFNQSARLPEGIYRFTIEVLDYNKNIVVSNAGTAMAWIILNDPPILNLPRNETKLQLIDPTNIVFTWTPRHRGSPNAALTTEYIFRLVEIWPASRNPYDAFLSQPPLYETTTDMQQLLYGPAEPALIPGRRYAWQVQAVDIEKRDLFKNGGRSEVFVFQYGDELTAPENLRLQSANPTNLTVRWDQVTGGTAATNFRVQYREHRNRSSNDWYEAQTTDQWRAIPQLKSDTEYEVQVRAEQQFQVSPYTVVQVFRTLTPGDNEFVCRDDAPPPPLPSSTTPLFELAINDTIKAGGYNVLVRSVTGGSGTYSGEGMAIIPYLNGAKVRVTFENIRVNGQNMLTAGIIKSYWNPDSKFMLKVETETKPGQVPSAGEIPVTIVATETLIEITGAAIATVSKDEDDNIVVHTTDGKQQTLEKGETYSVVDEQGNGYVIDDQGNIAKTSAAEARAAHDRGQRTYNLALTFAKGDGKLGFDDLPLRAPGQFSVLHPHYQQVDGTFIPWKAVTSSPQDAVTVIPDNAEMDLSGVRFEVNGVAVQPQNNSGNIKLNLYGKTGGIVEELIAITGDDEQSEVLGKLNLVSYDGITKNVVIVPVNNARLPGSLVSTELSNKLTEIFQQAVTKVQVSIAPNLNVTLNDTFDDGESGILSNYTGDMKKVINAFGNIQDDTYYLFLVEKPKSGGAALGFMPRSKQVGFIFADNLANGAHAVRTMAHELSHGMFNLKHTFSEFTALSRGTTENLMDYSATGTELLKYQWDYVHNPQRVIPLFEGDEEGESSWTIVDARHTRLFNHVYENNHVGQLTYINQINTALNSTPVPDTLGLNYDDSEDADWIKSWKIRVMDSETVFEDVIEAIQKTKKNQKIPKIVLRPNHVYIGKYKYEDREYPIAIYRKGEEGASAVMENAITKVQIADMDQLDADSVRTHLYAEETYTKYFVIAFYEDGKTEPSVMMQVEKFVFQESMEKWLRFLKIFDDAEAEEEPTEEVFLDQIQYVSQFDEEIFGLCTGCWTKSCCRRATEYMMGNTNIANCSDSTVAASAPYMAVLGKIVTASFSDNSTKYTKETYNAGSLNYDSNKAKEAVDYMKDRLRNNKSVLIGVHYTNGGKPPNNSNRATRHFMVIVGMTVKGENVSFRFYDPGRSIDYTDQATSTSNLLTYDGDKQYIQGQYNNKTYSLTEVVKTQ